MTNKKLSSRVDVQVSLITAIATLLASITSAILCYTISHDDALYSLEERVYSLYSVIEDELDMSTFIDINTPEDMKKDSYIDAKNKLEYLRDATGVLYLYTAKVNEDGEFIYIIDGLSMDDDFRFPGDLIEGEITNDMTIALGDEIVLPDNIKRTDWGDIYITYLPIHDEEDNVVGVVGIEFEAGHVYETYTLLRTSIPVFCIILCIASVLVSYRVFRRISNPHFKDIYNTDSLTGLKNRNAFELDTYNIDVSKNYENLGMIAGDLNRLKYVNDNFGHNVGDEYIKLVSEFLVNNIIGDMVVYRTGGDEFVIIARNTTEETMLNYIEKCEKLIKYQNVNIQIPASVAFGYALFDNDDTTGIFKRADINMYKNKREIKKQENKN